VCLLFPEGDPVLIPGKMLWLLIIRQLRVFFFLWLRKEHFAVFHLLGLRNKSSLFSPVTCPKMRRKLLLNSDAGLRCLYTEFVEVTLEQCVAVMS